MRVVLASQQFSVPNVGHASLATFSRSGPMSAFTTKADIRADEIDVCFVPLATKVQRSKTHHFASD
jgi:hypothetical protein